MDAILKYIDAFPTDFQLLTETAILSKQYWGYSNELIDLWRTDLEVSREYIQTNKVVKVYNQDTFIGFFSLKTVDKGVVEIDHLWVIPTEIKKGYGRQIFQYIKRYLQTQGRKTAQLIADPNAKGFYDKMGGQVVGQVQSKISGRFLDIYQYSL